jgi:iron-sulfur cluster assembly accessory protein
MSKEAITKDMTIGEVIDAYPVTAEILLDKGVHCIGCGARFLETIGQGLKSHGLSEKKIDAIVSDLNKAAKIIITVTPKAAKKLKEILKKEKKSGYFLRVQAVKGKSGHNYGLDFEKTQKKGDTAIKAHGLTLLIAAKSLPKVRGAKIDYIESPEPGFSIKGPKGR